MSRHETMNGRLKAFFKLLSTPFRHNLNFHRAYFFAIVNIVQLSFQNGEPSYDLEF
jgi:hypothetical protein